MKVARLLGVALMAVLAMSAFLASTASAIPKFKLPITNRGFVSLSLTSILRTLPPEEVTIICTHDVSAGTILGDDEIDVKVHFLNCREKTKTKECTVKSVGAPGSEGLILTELLLGLLGLLHSPNGAAGILLEPKSSHVFLTIAEEPGCGTLETAVEGSVAGLFRPTGKLQNTAEIVLAPVSATGKQEVTLILVLSGVVKPKLTSFGAAESSEETTDLVTYEEAVEVD